MFLKFVLLLKALSSCVSAYQWPNYVMDELEHLLVDTYGFNDGGFKRAITPCTNYVGGNQTLGRQTSAQWLRAAFHDFTTANITAGTGGIDASIQFETDRPENSGAAMNDSMGFFSPFANAHVSMADLIALSVVTSVGGCSSPTLRIPLRGGRIDATEGGETGVPEPESSLEETLAISAKTGFNQSDLIALTICGHTMGSVHHAGFPQVVPESAVTPDNLGGAIHFDATPGIFDHKVEVVLIHISSVHEYLSWEGQRGGALVTTENITVRSDLRLFTSDNNATIQRLATSQDYFKQSCVDLFTRMIDTVPSNVHLTEVITPNVVKPVNVSLSLDNNGGVVFSGYIRLLSVSFSDAATVKLVIHPYAAWSTATASLLHTGGSLFGNTLYYGFSMPVESISSFTITVTDGNYPRTFDNNGNGYPIQDNFFFLPDLSSTDEDGNVVIKAAVLTSTKLVNVSANIAVPTRMIGALGPRIDHIVVQLSPEETLGAYTIYGASTSVESMHVDQTTVDIVASYDGVTTPLSDKFRRLRSQTIRL
ncbi:heme peroxidase [Armillaria borealis]|uniref:Peroxidase n=1 Tax=Armillaria borealis TaxID=47425 RepID=A0AA39MIH9_9AGAR|nr:heme peroxidase [Armillaria borealis]